MESAPTTPRSTTTISGGTGRRTSPRNHPFDSPASTPYQVWVYYYSPTPDGGGGSGRCGTAHPTVNVYLGGTLSNTFTLTQGLPAFDAWHAADLAISNQGNTVTVTAGTTTAQQVAACSGMMRQRTAQAQPKDWVQLR